MARVRVQPGHYNRHVSLAHFPTAAGDAVTGVPLSPSMDWVWLQSQGGDLVSRSTSFLVELRYRSDVTIDTRLQYDDPVKNQTRYFFVRSVQNVNESNDVLRLVCEEVAP